MEIEQIVTEYLATDIEERRGLTGHVVDRDTSLFKDGIVDSIGLFTLASFLEARFGLTIADEDMVPDNFDSIARIASFVESRRRVPAS